MLRQPLTPGAAVLFERGDGAEFAGGGNGGDFKTHQFFVSPRQLQAQQERGFGELFAGSRVFLGSERLHGGIERAAFAGDLHHGFGGFQGVHPVVETFEVAGADNLRAQGGELFDKPVMLFDFVPRLAQQADAPARTAGVFALFGERGRESIGSGQDVGGLPRHVVAEVRNAKVEVEVIRRHGAIHSVDAGAFWAMSAS